MRAAAALILMALVASSCTFILTQPGVAAGCAPLRFEVNTNDIAISDAQVTAIGTAVVEFADLVGRDVENLGSTDSDVAGHAVGDPILFELGWPDDAPYNLGFAEPNVVGNTYAGGWVMLNPQVRHLPVGVLRRLVLHELGHLHGLADVDALDEIMNPALTTDAWGAGDLVGLLVTHAGGCDGSTLTAELEAAIA